MFNHKRFLKYQLEKLIVGAVILIVIVIIAMLTSCTNPKVKIVEREKEVHTKMSMADAMVSVYKFKKTEMESRRYDSGYTIDQVLDSMRRFEDSVQIYESEKRGLQATFDSLEMELKKY